MLDMLVDFPPGAVCIGVACSGRVCVCAWVCVCASLFRPHLWENRREGEHVWVGARDVVCMCACERVGSRSVSGVSLCLKRRGSGLFARLRALVSRAECSARTIIVHRKDVEKNEHLRNMMTRAKVR